MEIILYILNVIFLRLSLLFLNIHPHMDQHNHPSMPFIHFILSHSHEGQAESEEIYYLDNLAAVVEEHKNLLLVPHTHKEN